MSTSAPPRPVHVVAAETGSDRLLELMTALQAAGREARAHALPPGLVTAFGDEGAEERLRQELALAASAARTALAEDGIVVLADGRAGLVVPEMLRILMDEEGLGWDQAWAATAARTVARLGSAGDQPGPLWTVPLLEEVCPRHLEIVYEINRRHLEDVEARWPGDVDRRRNVSLFREGAVKRLRLGSLAIIGAGRAQVARPWEGSVGEILDQLNAVRDGALKPRPTQVSARRWLDDARPGLCEMLSLALGDRWRSEPEVLEELEKTAFDPAFRGAFRAERRASRERLGAFLQESQGLETDPEALVDLRVGTLDPRERLLLVVLGLVREHLRVTAGGWMPPAPRTVVIAREAGPRGPDVERVLALARAVADVINEDPRARPVLRVAVLPDCPDACVGLLAAAADLSNQSSTAGSGAAGTEALGLAVGGAVTLGTRDGTVREIEAAVGTENLFLFGLGPHEARAWRDGGVYRPRDVYTIDPLLRRTLDELVSTRYAPEPGAHDWVRDSLLDESDPWLVLASFGEYVHRQDEALAEFADPRAFTEKAILTVARCRRFWTRPLEIDP
jgi:starch phosphorylase